MTVTDATPALWETVTLDPDAFWTEAEIITAEADAEESFRNAQLDAQREAELEPELAA